MPQWSLLLSTLLCTQVALAQAIMGSTPRVQWTSHGRLVFDPFGQPLALDREVKPIPMPKPSAEDQAMRAPGSKELIHAAKGLHEFEDTEYATISRLEKVGTSYRLLARKEGGWQEVALLPPEPGYWQRTIFPLANGKYLVLSVLPFRTHPGDKPKGAHAAIYRRNEETGTLTPTTQIAFSHDAWMSNPTVSVAFYDFFFTDSTIVVACLEYGLFFVFSRTHGALLHEVRMHEEVTDRWIQQGKRAGVILSLQPLKDGTLLVAGRPADHIETYLKARDDHFQAEQAMMRSLMEMKDPQTGQEPEKKKASASSWSLITVLQDKRTQLAREHPAVAWFAVDPDKGTVKAVAEPVGAYSVADSEESQNHYFWLPEADGRIYYYSKDMQTRRARPGDPTKAASSLIAKAPSQASPSR